MGLCFSSTFYLIHDITKPDVKDILLNILISLFARLLNFNSLIIKLVVQLVSTSLLAVIFLERRSLISLSFIVLEIVLEII